MSAALIPKSEGGANNSGVVYLCLGKPQTFSCEVPKQEPSSFARLEWSVDFEDSKLIARLTQQYSSHDAEGEVFGDERSGISFMFNLTSNGLASLVSIMTVTMNNVNATAVISNATVNCDDEAYPIMLQIRIGINFRYH